MVAEYRYDLLIFKIVLAALALIAPIVMILHGGPWAALVSIAWLVAAILLAFEGDRVMGIPKRWGILTPVGIAIFVICLTYALVNSIRVGGLYWRGRVYPLDQLRKLHRVKI